MPRRALLRKLRLDLILQGRLPQNLGEVAHGLLMSLPSFSALHDEPVKPFSLFPESLGEQGASLELNLLGEFDPEPELARLAGRKLGSAQVLAVSGKVVCEGSFRELVIAKPFRKIPLIFKTPTAFRSQGKHRVFPEPELVFGSLLRRWNSLSPLNFHEIPFSEILVSRFRLTTEPFYLGNLTLIGFVGEVVYDLKNLSAPERRVVSALARFAQFAGVGYKTTMGMGKVELGRVYT